MEELVSFVSVGFVEYKSLCLHILIESLVGAIDSWGMLIGRLLHSLTVFCTTKLLLPSTQAAQ